MGEKRGLELLRSIIDELDPNVECSELHSLFGDGEGGCLGRLCSSCQGEALRVALRQADEEMKDLKAKLMPEGMEWILEVWPKWSNGEYCKFGDWWKADEYGEYEPMQLTRLTILAPEQLREWGQDDGDSHGYEWNFLRPIRTAYRPDKVEPPAPKVLDADGVEIHVGDMVYYVDGREQKVNTVARLTDGLVQFGRINEAGYVTYCEGACISPDQLTHRAPVLAADGKPLREGETVYAKNYGYVKCTVLAIEWVVDGYLVEVENEGGHKFRQTPDEFTHQRPVLDADGVLCREGDEVWEVRSHRRREIVGTHYRDYETGEPLILCDGDDAIPIPATCVTHERPDSWERIEEDLANEMARQQCGPICPEIAVDEAAKLVRRAKKLAGVS